VANPSLTEAISSQTELLHAYRFVRLLEQGEIGVDRLSEKLAKAGGVVARVHANIEAKADAVIAREEVLTKRTTEAFSPHHAMLDDAAKGLDALEAQLALVTNDPLPSSGASLEGETASIYPITQNPPKQR